RSRLPKLKAEVSGAHLAHPSRFKDRTGPKNARPVGDPYPRMTKEQKAVWLEMAAEMPWLNSAHRQLLRLACLLAARLDTAPEFGVAASRALTQLLAKLGATPVDAARLNLGCDAEEDEDDAFFGRSG